MLELEEIVHMRLEQLPQLGLVERLLGGLGGANNAHDGAREEHDDFAFGMGILSEHIAAEDNNLQQQEQRAASDQRFIEAINEQLNSEEVEFFGEEEAKLQEEEKVKDEETDARPRSVSFSGAQAMPDNQLLAEI